MTQEPAAVRVQTSDPIDLNALTDDAPLVVVSQVERVALPEGASSDEAAAP